MTEDVQQYNHFIYVCRHFAKDNAVGWIDPEGAVHTTSLHGHLSFFMDEFAPAVPGLEDCLLYPAREFHDRQTEEWAELYSRGARRWHEFDPTEFVPEWEQERDAYDAIYSAGWGRVGRFDGILGVECYAGFEEPLLRAANDIASVVECEVRVTAVDRPSSSPGC